jgi:hypothetical protein
MARLKPERVAEVESSAFTTPYRKFLLAGVGSSGGEIRHTEIRSGATATVGNENPGNGSGEKSDDDE